MVAPKRPPKPPATISPGMKRPPSKRPPSASGHVPATSKRPPKGPGPFQPPANQNTHRRKNPANDTPSNPGTPTPTSRKLTHTQKGLIAGNQKVVHRKIKEYRTNHAGTSRAEAQTALNARMGRVQAARKASPQPKPATLPIKPRPATQNPPTHETGKVRNPSAGSGAAKVLRDGTTFHGKDKFKPSNTNPAPDNRPVGGRKPPMPPVKPPRSK